MAKEKMSVIEALAKLSYDYMESENTTAESSGVLGRLSRQFLFDVGEDPEEYMKLVAGLVLKHLIVEAVDA